MPAVDRYNRGRIEREDCVEICVAREEAPAKSSSDACCPPPQMHGLAPYLLSREDPAKSEPPHLPPGSDLGGREDPPLPRHLPGPRFTQSLALRGGEVTVYDDISESENYEASSQTPDELPVAGEGSASAKHSQHRLNIPDVCPVTVNTYEPLLQHVRLQETILEYPEDHISVSSETSQNSRCSGCRDGSCSPYPAAVTPSHKLSAAPKASQKRPFPEPACPSTSAKPITQVIYHGQPHLQQQLEQERELDQSRQPKLYEYHLPHLPPHICLISRGGDRRATAIIILPSRRNTSKRSIRSLSRRSIMKTGTCSTAATSSHHTGIRTTAGTRIDSPARRRNVRVFIMDMSSAWRRNMRRLAPRFRAVTVSRNII
ncbi:hypothetical protein C7M84_001017 [Penaeus vannamei]|uniref:Uncharacterized protein n=1 Tax=Penaeus vannamei TaxID=6689 RepID=A0A3R7PXJ4_PENVA|nr:hypothetical protein C7M84_001017 [Penaeus vannamei]